MFKKITLKNYRTHKLTVLELRPLTLLIGNNSSGKTNFLSGVKHFSQLIGRSFLPNMEDRCLVANDYRDHRYLLASAKEGMSIEIEWEKDKYIVLYSLELYANEIFPAGVGCREKIEVRSPDETSSKKANLGCDKKKETNLIEMASKFESILKLKGQEKNLLNNFFNDCQNIASYHLQPSFLKGLLNDNTTNLDEWLEGLSDHIDIPSYLGYEGKNLQHLIYFLKNRDEKVFTRFLILMRRFANNQNFLGVRYDKQLSQLFWEFDLGRNKADRLSDEFLPDVISDGLMKAAAIALLVSIQKPPALILIEEIENGVNPGNIQELINWMWQATSSDETEQTPQFILTSHSPSVLREFNENLDAVYTFRLNKRDYRSDVRNLSTALDTLIGIGAVEGEIIDKDEKTGKRSVQIPKFQLAELWYSGTIG